MVADFAGVPRELGFAQGRAARAALRAAAADAWTRAFDVVGWQGAASARWWRDLARHFPHQSEWLEGAARGAALPLPALVRVARRSLSGAPRALVGWEQAGAARLACALEPEVTLRRVAPEGRFRSLEAALPWLSSPWLGVNEAGFALVVSPGAGDAVDCAAPAALFARDCLERFESVASALAWCLSRPAAPGAQLLFADAAGELAGVDLRAASRRVCRPEGGLIALGTDAAGRAALAKAQAAGAPDARALAAALGAPAERCAQADPRARSLWRDGAAACLAVGSLPVSESAPAGAPR